MAIHIDKTCEVRSYGGPGRCVPGVWRRCKLLYEVIALDSDALLRWWIAEVTVMYVAGWCPLGGLGCVCSGVLRP